MLMQRFKILALSNVGLVVFGVVTRIGRGLLAVHFIVFFLMNASKLQSALLSHSLYSRDAARSDTILSRLVEPGVSSCRVSTNKASA
jgi:hypothetical protein